MPSATTKHRPMCANGVEYMKVLRIPAALHSAADSFPATVPNLNPRLAGAPASLLIKTDSGQDQRGHYTNECTWIMKERTSLKTTVSYESSVFYSS